MQLILRIIIQPLISNVSKIRSKSHFSWTILQKCQKKNCQAFQPLFFGNVRDGQFLSQESCCTGNFDKKHYAPFYSHPKALCRGVLSVQMTQNVIRAQLKPDNIQGVNSIGQLSANRTNNTIFQKEWFQTHCTEEEFFLLYYNFCL